MLHACCVHQVAISSFDTSKNVTNWEMTDEQTGNGLTYIFTRRKLKIQGSKLLMHDLYK